MNTSEEEKNAAHLLVEAAEKAALLITEAAEKAALLPIDAAEKAALLIKDVAAEQHVVPAETKAALLLREAAEKALLLPKDSIEKMSDLFQDATKSAILILKEEAETLAANKIKFLDIAAHELRNPIASISLLLRVAERQVEKNEALSFDILARMRLPVDRLARLVVDLLDMSKLERGQLVLVPVKVNLASLILQCVEEFQIEAPKRKFIFNRPDQPIEIKLDPLRIYQVLASFLDNAIKYTSEGTIEVGLSTTDSAVRVSVTDHGAGIPQEKKSLLFTVFSRDRLDSTVHDGGLGLGLSVCRGIIDLHNGIIGFESEVGKGSTFYFELPKKDPKENNDE